MQRNMRREREKKDSRENNKPLSLVPEKAKTEAAEVVMTPTLSVPRSWTSAFCFKMVELADADQNPLNPIEWRRRAQSIRDFEDGRLKKHPYVGMPVDNHGREVPPQKKVYSHDLREALLGFVADRSDAIPHAE